MIVFATAMADPEAYKRFAAPGIARAAGPDAVVLRFASAGGPARDNNLLLDRVRDLEGLEALVIVNERVELSDPGTEAVVRAALVDPDVAITGSLGASGVRSIAWWEGQASAAPGVHRYSEHGGGDVPPFAWRDPQPAPADVDALDGSLLVLSPWAVRELRFDERLVHGHGYDLDVCLQARELGRRVTTAPIATVRHRPLELVEELDTWVEAHIDLARKWSARAPALLHQDVTDWESRARRAEADREAARTVAYSNASLLEARVKELEAALATVTDTASWKLTEPLRRANALRRKRQEG